MIAGLLPGIAQTLSEPIAIVGQGITAFAVSYLISAPYFSVSLARYSLKKKILSALVVFILGNCLTVFSESLFLFISSRVITGIGAGLFNPLAVDLAIRIVGTDKKGKALSLVWGAHSVGVVFGVPIGVYLSQVISWQVSILIMVVLSLISFMGLLFSKGDYYQKGQNYQSRALKTVLNPSVIGILGISLLTCMVTTGLYSFVSLLQKKSLHALPMILLIWGGGGVIGSFFIGRVVDRLKKPQLVMSILLFGLALNFVLLAQVVNIYIVGLIPFFIWGCLGWATVNPQVCSLIEGREDYTSELSAFNSSAIGLGGAIGTSFGGLLLSGGIQSEHLLYLASIFLFLVLIIQVLKNGLSREVGEKYG